MEISTATDLKLHTNPLDTNPRNFHDLSFIAVGNDHKEIVPKQVIVLVSLPKQVGKWYQQ